MSETLPKISVPPPEPVTQEEIERRRKLYESLMRRRANMQRLGMDAAELIRRIREDVPGQ